MPFLNKQKIIINCFPFLSKWLEKELKQHGFAPEGMQRTGAVLAGSYEDTLYLNYHLRTASRVLYEIDSFRADTPDRLYRELLRIPWEKIIPAGGYISVGGFIRNEKIRDNRFAFVRVKDAVVDRIKEKTGERPDAGPESDRTVLFIHWVDNIASICIDTSGETITKHGYRQLPGKAPMMESLAAGVIMATVWDRQQPFINPMCGSGTLAIEAALMAGGIYPGKFRENYGFMHTRYYDPAAWERIRSEADRRPPAINRPMIVATDRDPAMIEAARKNAAKAGVESLIDFKVCDFRQTPVPEDQQGIVILNPEYGERMGEVEKLRETYVAIGDYFKNSCRGYTGYVFTGNLDLAKSIGLRTRSRTEFLNARIECRLLEYELYAGSKKRSPAL